MLTPEYISTTVDLEYELYVNSNSTAALDSSQTRISSIAMTCMRKQRVHMVRLLAARECDAVPCICKRYNAHVKKVPTPAD